MSKKISTTLSDQTFDAIVFLAEKDGRDLSSEINFMLQQYLIKEESNHYHPKVKECKFIYRIIQESNE